MGARILFVGVFLAWGCGFDRSGSGPEDAGASDPDAGSGGSAEPDAEPPIDAAPIRCGENELRLPFEAANLGHCAPEPSEALVVPEGDTWEIETDSEGDVAVVALRASGPNVEVARFENPDVRSQDGQAPDLVAISVEELELEEGAVLWATGPRALALIAEEGVTIAEGARISGGGISGREAGAFTTIPGAGASEALCDAEGQRGDDGERQDFDGSEGGSGGGGGGFGTSGGRGAPVNEAEGDPEPTPGGAGGGAEQGLEPLRGGCSGGSGHGARGADDAAGGGGGGALQIVSPETISAEGAISVSGAGAQVGAEHSGGGGGGSGGGLLLQARSIEIAGALTASGGGGGEGMRRVSGFSCPGFDGEDGFRHVDGPAPGGDTEGCDTSGRGGFGDAAARDEENEAVRGEEGDSTSGVSTAAGGGGGGGGMGVVIAEACDEIDVEGAALSPEPATQAELDCDG